MTILTLGDLASSYLGCQPLHGPRSTSDGMLVRTVVGPIIDYQHRCSVNSFEPQCKIKTNILIDNSLVVSLPPTYQAQSDSRMSAMKEAFQR